MKKMPDGKYYSFNKTVTASNCFGKIDREFLLKNGQDLEKKWLKYTLYHEMFGYTCKNQKKISIYLKNIYVQ